MIPCAVAASPGVAIEVVSGEANPQGMFVRAMHRREVDSLNATAGGGGGGVSNYQSLPEVAHPPADIGTLSVRGYRP